MLTHHRLRHATRWNRRLVFALVILLLLSLSWRAYRAWQPAQPHAPEQRGQLAYFILSNREYYLLLSE